VVSRWAEAGIWSGDGLRREVFFFRSGGVDLYGSLYASAEPTRPLGVVACGSWGVEADRTDPLLRAVALGAARLGGAGLVFHYPGYGDSHGDLAEVTMADLSRAASDAVAEGSRRCPAVGWALAGFMLGASVASLAQQEAGVERLLFVQPALRPSAYFLGLAEKTEPLPRGSSSRKTLEAGAAAGWAYGYPIPQHIVERAGEADSAVGEALAAFGSGGAVIRQATRERVGVDEVPERFERIEVAGRWRFGSQNHPELAEAAIEWLDRVGGGAGG
jgi:hypothetical protein